MRLLWNWNDKTREVTQHRVCKARSASWGSAKRDGCSELLLLKSLPREQLNRTLFKAEPHPKIRDFWTEKPKSWGLQLKPEWTSGERQDSNPGYVGPHSPRYPQISPVLLSSHWLGPHWSAGAGSRGFPSGEQMGNLTKCPLPSEMGNLSLDPCSLTYRQEFFLNQCIIHALSHTKSTSKPALSFSIWTSYYAILIHLLKHGPQTPCSDRGCMKCDLPGNPCDEQWWFW